MEARHAGTRLADEQRPSIAAGGPAAHEAQRVVDEFVAELQAGLDGRDADVYNCHFAQDVMWGSPYGETVAGYDDLHAIHARLQARAVGGENSRYSVVEILRVTDDVVVAHVRRDPPADAELAASSGAFAEMAMYVLTRRGTEWWLAAGQNTPIRATLRTEGAA